MQKIFRLLEDHMTREQFDNLIKNLSEKIKLGQPGLYERAIAFNNFIEGANAAYDLLIGEIAELEEKLRIAIELIERQTSWLHRMSELKWNDKSYAPKFKAMMKENHEALSKLKGGDK